MGQSMNHALEVHIYIERNLNVRPAVGSTVRRRDQDGGYNIYNSP